VVERVSLDYVLREERWDSLPGEQKPCFEEVQRLEETLSLLSFPEGRFKQQLGRMVALSKQLRAESDKVFSLCNWDYRNEEGEPDYERKVGLEEVSGLAGRLERCPLRMSVAAIECRLIVRKFNEAEQAAAELLASSLVSEADRARASRTANALGGSPIRSAMLKRLLGKLEPAAVSEQQLRAESLYSRVVSKQMVGEYSELTRLLAYFESDYRGSFPRETCVQRLRRLLEPVSRCLEQFRAEVEQFRR
jgi:hypothetical protein